MIDLNTAGGIITLVTVIGVPVTAIFLSLQYRNNQKQLLVSNFSTITSYIGTELTKECRGIIHNHEEELQKLNKYYCAIEFKKLETYNIEKNVNLFLLTLDKDECIRLRRLLEIVKYVASIYNRVGFLMEQDAKLRKELTHYHGLVIGKMWILINNIIKQHPDWKNGYGYFHQAFHHAYQPDYHWESLHEFQKKLGYVQKNNYVPTKNMNNYVPQTQQHL